MVATTQANIHTITSMLHKAIEAIATIAIVIMIDTAMVSMAIEINPMDTDISPITIDTTQAEAITRTIMLN